MSQMLMQGLLNLQGRLGAPVWERQGPLVRIGSDWCLPAGCFAVEARHPWYPVGVREAQEGHERHMAGWFTCACAFSMFCALCVLRNARQIHHRMHKQPPIVLVTTNLICMHNNGCHMGSLGWPQVHLAAKA